MLRIKTYISESDIHGIGLFADQPVSEGSVIWKFDPPFDVAFSEGALGVLPTPARELTEKYAYYEKTLNQFILCGDDARFMNHSITPNAEERAKVTIALRDIKIGEELTCNYGDYETDCGNFR